MITTIDSHTGGEPTRTITGGLPHISGRTMVEKMHYVSKNYDWLRKALMLEPRGHSVMSGAILTEPVNTNADVGVIFIEVGGYLPMCGHDTIGVCTALVETGMVEVTEPVTEIVLDTPAGVVSAQVEINDGRAQSVTFTSVEAMVLHQGVELELVQGRVVLDIVYGGNVFAILDTKQLGLTIAPKSAADIITTAGQIRTKINESISIKHPHKQFITGCTHVQFTNPVDDELTATNAVVFPPGAIDRSPCGTGTTARLALMHARDQIDIGQQFTHKSIIGSQFTASIVKTIDHESYTGVVSKITGSAFITGFNKLVIDDSDPLKHGFWLG